MNLSLNGISSLATVAGIAVMIYQLSLTQRDLRSAFERTFNVRYQNIAGRIELDVLLGRRAADLDDPVTLRAFFDYFELCEEQLYFRSHRRISASCWHDWWYGISTNLSNESFTRAFELLVAAETTEEFSRRFWMLPLAFDARTSPTTYEPPTRFQRPTSPTTRSDQASLARTEQ